MKVCELLGFKTELSAVFLLETFPCKQVKDKPYSWFIPSNAVYSPKVFHRLYIQVKRYIPKLEESK